MVETVRAVPVVDTDNMENFMPASQPHAPPPFAPHLAQAVDVAGVSAGRRAECVRLEHDSASDRRGRRQSGLMTAPYNIDTLLCSLSRNILAASLAVRHFGDLARPTIHP